jgi:cell division protein FtsL
MSSIAQGVRATGAPRVRRRSRSAARPRLLAGGVVWIVLFAVLLGGVVAVNVAVLRLNLQLDGVGRERTELKADVARIRGELSSAAATAEIARVAEKDLGLARADQDSTIYVTLPSR